MIERPPAYIPERVLGNPHLSYRWDDWKASEDFTYNPEPFLAEAGGLTRRAQIALTLGLYEWVIWRLKFASPDPTPFQIAEAAWCAIVNTKYMTYYEFDRHQWVGPVRGPLWCAMTWLIPAVLLSDDDPEELESGISYLVRLAHHIVEDDAALDNWATFTLDRFHSLYPAVPEDPFEDLFGEHKEERRGPLVPQEALDPKNSLRPGETSRLIDRFLRTVNYAANPFLKSPEVLQEEGFAGTPYRLEPA